MAAVGYRAAGIGRPEKTLTGSIFQTATGVHLRLAGVTNH